MVELMSGYLFARPEYWYNPRKNTTPRSWTQSSVPETDWRTSRYMS